MSNEFKSLADTISIKRQFLKSIRIDSDIKDRSALDGFIPLQSSLNIVDSMCATVLSNHNCAFTWSGAFGSGKSTLALLLSSLISEDSVIRSKALAYVKGYINSQDGNNIVKLFAKKGAYKSWASINIVGSNTSLRNALLRALEQDNRTSFAIESDTLDLAALEHFIDALKEKNQHVLIIVDELGKFLQQAVETNDIYFLQEISEAAARSEGHLVFLGIMHQSFESYIANSNKRLRDEWAKIQGRFENLLLAPSEFESINLVASSIDNSSYKKAYDPASVANILYPKSAAIDAIVDSFNKCLPLHPVSILLVCAISRLYFGQNERTIYGFLNSFEPFSFSSFMLSENRDSTNLYLPHHLFDYVRNNQSLVGYGQASKLYAEACEIIGNIDGRCSSTQLWLFKTIAVIELFGKGYSISSKKELLAEIYGHIASSVAKDEGDSTESSFEKDIAFLVDAKAVIYRAYDDSYGCFKGSDFDFDSAFAEAYNASDISLDGIKQYLSESRTVVAKRHYVETGNLRYFEVEAVLAQNLISESSKSTCSNAEIGKVFLVFFNSNGDFNSALAETILVAQSCSEKYKNHIYAICMKSEDIFHCARSLNTYREILQNPLLEGDEVARREVNDRANQEHKTLESLVFDSLNGSLIVHGGQVLSKLLKQTDEESALPLLEGFSAEKNKEYLAFDNLSDEAEQSIDAARCEEILEDIAANFALNAETQESLKKDVESKYSAIYSACSNINSHRLKVKSSELWVLASDIADALFNKAPVIKNELINRNKLSSSVAKARRVLMEHMCDHASAVNLGFEKTPPELNLYWTIFELHGLHRQTKAGYEFVLDDSANPKMRGLFLETDALLAAQQNATTAAIFELWSRPPFGVKDGLHLILLLFYILVNKERVAVYNDGVFVTDFSSALISEMLVNSDKFTFRLYKSDKQSVSAENSIADALQACDIKYDSTEPLSLARALVFFMMKLPMLTQRTINLSKRAQRLKSYVLNANDPLDLIYDKIFSLYTDIAKDNSLFIDDLNEVKNYYGLTLNKIKAHILKSLGCNEDAAAQEIKERASAIADVSASENSKVELFIKRLAHFDGEQQSLETILTLCTDKPVKALTDHDISVCMSMIPELAMGFRKAECFAGFHDKKSDRSLVSVVSSTPDGNDISEIVELTAAELQKAKENAIDLLKKLGKVDYRQVVGVCAELLRLASQGVDKLSELQNRAYELDKKASSKNDEDSGAK